MNLFGEPITTRPTREQQRESQTAERKRKQRIAYDATSEKWKAAVYEFAVGIYLVDCTEHFIFEELTAAYEAYAELFGKPLTVQKRAFAGLQARLLKEGLIEVVEGETGRSYEGAIRQKYRSLVT